MIVPIFQRAYSWKYEQVKTLWDDILKLYNNIDKNEETKHFLGPIVRVEVSTSSVDTKKLYLIDGQQRIATLMILLACLRNIFKEKDDSVVRKIESGYLLNYGELEPNRYKLILSEPDRDIFRKIISSEENVQESKLKDTYKYFTKKLKSQKVELNMEKLRRIIINNLMLVNIDVDKNENPYLIFESLNAKGTPLTQADLIRNYIFMKISSEDEQKELYKRYWMPMELLLGDGLENFFWRYSLKDGTFVKIKRTYSNLKSDLETNSAKSAETELKKLREYSVYYSRLISPDKEPNSELLKRFIRHNRWEIGTAYPFLLNIYKDYQDQKISDEVFCQILEIIESFVIRRFFCKRPSNRLNRLFISLYKNLDITNIIKSLKYNLLDDCPKDEEFGEGLKSFPIYSSGTEKCSLVLETIEESFHHKEPVHFENLQIEHIMPQVQGDQNRLPPQWKEMLGKNYKDVYSKYVHTLGNLTLTGYNQELSIKPFLEKKELLRQSHLEMNKYFETIRKWDEEEIIKRADFQIKIAKSIWKDLE